MSTITKEQQATVAEVREALKGVIVPWEEWLETQSVCHDKVCNCAHLGSGNGRPNEAYEFVRGALLDSLGSVYVFGMTRNEIELRNAEINHGLMLKPEHVVYLESAENENIYQVIRRALQETSPGKHNYIDTQAECHKKKCKCEDPLFSSKPSEALRLFSKYMIDAVDALEKEARDDD